MTAIGYDKISSFNNKAKRIFQLFPYQAITMLCCVLVFLVLNWNRIIIALTMSYFYLIGVVEERFYKGHHYIALAWIIRIFTTGRGSTMSNELTLSWTTVKHMI